MRYSVRELPPQWRLFCRHHYFADGAVLNDHAFGTDEQLASILRSIELGQSPSENTIRHLSRNRSRKYRGRRALAATHLRPQPLQHSPSAYRQFAVRENIEWVRAHTSEDEWRALDLLAHGFFYGEIAPLLGTSVANLKSRVSRCRQRLRAQAADGLRAA